METTRWHLSNDMYSILVYCCVGMLMTSCFGGCHSHFRTQKNHASATKIDNFHRYFSARADGIHFNFYMNSTLSVWAEKKRWKLSISFLIWTGNNRYWIIQSTVSLHEIRGTSQNSVYIFVSILEYPFFAHLRRNTPWQRPPRANWKTYLTIIYYTSVSFKGTMDFVNLFPFRIF